MTNAKIVMFALLAVVIVAAAITLSRNAEPKPGTPEYTQKEIAEAIEKASVPDGASPPVTAEQERALESASAEEEDYFGDTKEEQDILKLLEAQP